MALGKKVYASSNQQPPELAVDDNLGTRWESKASDGDNQWFYVDLEKGTIIDHLKIVWEGAYGKHYKIHVADEITAEMALKLTEMTRQTISQPDGQKLQKSTRLCRDFQHRRP